MTRAKRQRSERDARLALASLTVAGAELVDEASTVFDEVGTSLLWRTGNKAPTMTDLVIALL